MDATFDAVVIGSGHNALITAAYLCRAGWSVLILEQNDRPGGLVRSDALTVPGFVHDTYSAAHPLFVTSAAYAELGPELSERGLNYLNTDVPTGVSFPDGRTAVFSRAMDDNIAEADRLAAGDGMALAQMFADFEPYVGDVFTLFNLDLASPAAQEIIGKLMRDPQFASFLFSTARTVVSRFQSPVMQAMLAPWVIHLGRIPDEVGSAIWVPLVFLALMAGGMPIPQGGCGKLAEAFTRLITDRGGQIKTHTRATQIVVKDGKAAAVRTEQGEEYQASRAVIASVNPDQLYLQLLADADVSPPLKKQAANFRYGRGCVQISLALSEAPRWPDERFAKVGQPHLSDGLNGCTLACAQAMAGLLPATPTFTVDCASNLDAARAPAGNATMRVQVLEVPCVPQGDAAGQIEVGDGAWSEDLKQRYAERILGIVGQHIPNIPQSMIGMHIVSPGELAAFSPNQGPGDPYGGAHDLAQSYVFRPLPGQAAHRSVVPNVFMVGAATWPGHGVNGGSGYIVAQELIALSK